MAAFERHFDERARVVRRLLELEALVAQRVDVADGHPRESETERPRGDEAAPLAVPGPFPREEIHHREEEQERRDVHVATRDGMVVARIRVNANEPDDRVHRQDAEEAPDGQGRWSSAEAPAYGERRESDEQKEPPQVGLRHVVDAAELRGRVHDPPNEEAHDGRLDVEPPTSERVAAEQREPDEKYHRGRNDGERAPT